MSCCENCAYVLELGNKDPVKFLSNLSNTKRAASIHEGVMAKCSSEKCSLGKCSLDKCSSDKCSLDKCSSDKWSLYKCSSDKCSLDKCSSNKCSSDKCSSYKCSLDKCSSDKCSLDRCSLRLILGQILVIFWSIHLFILTISGFYFQEISISPFFQFLNFSISKMLVNFSWSKMEAEKLFCTFQPISLLFSKIFFRHLNFSKF